MSSKFEISINEFKLKLDHRENIFLLDLRLEDEFDSWKIESDYDFEIINIPQLDFVGEEEKFLDQLPKNKEIYIVCAHGEASVYSAEVLNRYGLKAKGLAGGMDAWSVLYETSPYLSGPENLSIYQIFRVAKGCITHVLVSGKEALVIDCVRHLDHVKKILKKHDAQLKYVFDTHLQADHISGGRELAAQTSCLYGMNPLDAADASYEFLQLEDGQHFEFGSTTIRTFHTPGHTPGSTSFILDNQYLFGGDTVMRTSVGRPDLGGMVEAWAELLYQTIHVRLGELSDDIIISPTHAVSVRERNKDGVVCFTLGEARGALPIFSLTDKDEFMKHIKTTLMENPERYKDIRQVNLGLLETDEKKLGELEIGKNLCGMAPKGSS